MIKLLKRWFRIKDDGQPKPGQRIPLKPIFIAPPPPQMRVVKPYVYDGPLTQSDDNQSRSLDETLNITYPDILGTHWSDTNNSIDMQNTYDPGPSNDTSPSVEYGGGDPGGGGTSGEW
jgi:uncharacterized membrane protein YgcG